MQQDHAEIERKISRDRTANFRGTALVRLEVLDFDAKGSRDADYKEKLKRSDFDKNVKRLKDIFRKGCYPFRPGNRISATVDQRTLDDAIRASPAETTLEALLKNPCEEPPVLKFPPNYRLKCLQGRSRVQAAKEILPPQEWVWAVELYLEDATYELQRVLAEQYDNSANFLPGEVYYNIRYYCKDGPAKADWLARLTPNQKDEVTQFLKQESSLLAAFDKLLVFRGQWFGFRPSMLPEIMAMKCDEEHLHYLEHIRTVWSLILHGDRKLMSLTDSNTVKELQLRVPGLCADDAEFVKSMMNNGVLFPRIESPEERQRILYDLLQIKTPIPTIATYFEDIKVLSQYKKIMKRLLGNKIKETVRLALQDSFTGVNQKEGEVRVQETESSFKSYQGNLTDRINLGIIQLGLFALRDSPQLIPDCPLKEDGQDTPVPQKPKASVWQAFATLAYDLGFESGEIHRLRSKNPDREIARAALLEARDPGRFKYEEKEFESFQDQMEDMFARASKLSSRSTSPTFFVDGPGESLQRRFGRPFTNAYASYRQSFFLKALTVSDHVGGKGITPIFVRVSIYRAFFGELIPSALPNPLGPVLESENRAFPLRQNAQMSTPSMTSEQRNRLEEERDRLRSELTKAADDQSKLKQNLEEQKADMGRMVRELNEELRNRVVRQDELQREVERLRGGQARVRGEHDEHKDSAEKKIRGLTDEIVVLRSQRESEAKALQSALVQNEKISAALEQKLKSCETVASDTSQRLHRENEELRNANNTFEQVLKQSEAVQLNALNEALIEKQKLSASNEELREEIRKLSIDKDEFQQKLERCKATQSEAVNEILAEKEKLLVSNKELYRQKEELTKRNDELQQDFKRSQITHLHAVDELLAKTKSEADDLRAEVALLEDNKVKMERGLDGKEPRTRELQNELATLKTTLSEKNQEMERLKGSAEAEILKRLQIEETNRTTKEQLTRAVEERDHATKQLESENKALGETNNSLKADMDLLERKLASLSEEASGKLEETNRITQEQLRKAAEEREHAKNKLTIKIAERDMLEESLTAKIGSLERELASLRDETNWLILSSIGDQKISILVRDIETIDESAHMINFKVFRNGHAEIGQSLLMSAAELERVGNKCIRKGIHLYTTDYRGLLPRKAFDAVVKDGTYTILLVPEGEKFEVREEVLASDSMLDTDESRKLKKLRARRKFNLPGMRVVPSFAFKELDPAEKQLNPFANLSAATDLSQTTVSLSTEAKLSQGENRIGELKGHSRTQNGKPVKSDHSQLSGEALKPEEPKAKRSKK